MDEQPISLCAYGRQGGPVYTQDTEEVGLHLQAGFLQRIGLRNADEHATGIVYDRDGVLLSCVAVDCGRR